MRAFYCDHFVLPLPEGHRFPMAKYRLLREAVLASGLVTREELRVPEAATSEELTRAHTGDYVTRVVRGELDRQEVRRLGFPWSPAMVERSRRSAGATLAACRVALSEGVAVNLAGGTHHAFADRGEGYCLFNDAAVAARAMLAEGLVRRVLVVDTDVHQGNGTAAIFRDDPAVFTFSIHGARNFPFHKEVSDLDLALDDGTADEAYLAALADGLDQAFSRARPELVIFVSGADPHRDDRLGRLALSFAGLAARDAMVFARAVAAECPVAVAMAGGYGTRVEDTVRIHLGTVAAARRTWETLRGIAPATRRGEVLPGGAGGEEPWRWETPGVDTEVPAL
jgi:acetoin utilization deacetylase AcuC-like enzyme